MKIQDTIKDIIEREGRTQKWIVSEMNRISPSVKMDAVKFSAIVTGRRNMQADELIAFCKATGQNPDIFLRN